MVAAENSISTSTVAVSSAATASSFRPGVPQKSKYASASAPVGYSSRRSALPAVVSSSTGSR